MGMPRGGGVQSTSRYEVDPLDSHEVLPSNLILNLLVYSITKGLQLFTTVC